MKKLLFDKKDVFTALNREEAEIYIGEKGYYCYRMHEWIPCELVKVHFDEDYDVRDVFTILDHKTELECPMFLPADKVRTPEYRPFETFEEFKACTNKDVGDVIVFKEKNTDSINTTLVTGYHGSCLHELGLGCMSYSFQELFHNYLWLDANHEWKTFGIQE